MLTSLFTSLFTPPLRHCFQSVVYNQWQGLTFMLLDVLKDHNMRYYQAIEAALHVNKYNLALTFVRKQRNNDELKVTNSDGRNLWHVLMLTADSQVPLQLRVSRNISTIRQQRNVLY